MAYRKTLRIMYSRMQPKARSKPSLYTNGTISNRSNVTKHFQPKKPNKNLANGTNISIFFRSCFGSDSEAKKTPNWKRVKKARLKRVLLKKQKVFVTLKNNRNNNRIIV